MEDKRFSGNLGKEYDLFYMALPYLLTLENEVGVVLKKYIDAHWPQDYSGKIVVCDGGCGTGTTTEIALNADPRIQVIAIDNESAMLSQAKEKLKEFKERVRFVEGDLVKEINNTNEINIFVSGFTIHNFPPPPRQEFFKALGTAMKSGGIFINVDKIARNDEDEHQKDLQAEFDMFGYFGEHGHPELEKGWKEHYLEDDKIRLTEKEYAESLQKNGFGSVQFLSRQYTDVIAVAEKN